MLAEAASETNRKPGYEDVIALTTQKRSTYKCSIIRVKTYVNSPTR